MVEPRPPSDLRVIDAPAPLPPSTTAAGSPVAPRVTRWVLPALVAGIVVAGLRPWVLSGRAPYDGFALARIARELDLGGSAGVLPVLWATVPVLAALVLLAAVLQRSRAEASLAIVTAVVAIVVAGAVGHAAPAAGLEVLAAPYAAAGFAALTLVVALRWLWALRR